MSQTTTVLASVEVSDTRLIHVIPAAVVIGSPPLGWTPHYQFSEKLSIKLRNVGLKIVLQHISLPEFFPVAHLPNYIHV